MQLQITSDNIPLAGTVRNLVEKHLSEDLIKSLSHFPDDIKKANVRILKQSRHGYKVTFEMQLPGHRIYSEETHDKLPTAITVVRDEVKKQIVKYKEKLTTRQADNF